MTLLVSYINMIKLFKSSVGSVRSFGFPDRTDHGNIIDSNIDTKWKSNKRREWIQVDMKTSHYVHRVHIKMDNK